MSCAVIGNGRDSRGVAVTAYRPKRAGATREAMAVPAGEPSPHWTLSEVPSLIMN